MNVDAERSKCSVANVCRIYTRRNVARELRSTLTSTRYEMQASEIVSLAESRKIRLAKTKLHQALRMM
jgi:hypothetical protein